MILQNMKMTITATQILNLGDKQTKNHRRSKHKTKKERKRLVDVFYSVVVGKLTGFSSTPHKFTQIL